MPAVFHAAGGGGGIAQEEGDVRCGAARRSMQTNPLLVKAQLGKVKPSMFNNPPANHAFGYTLPRDPEHAREVTMIWKEHSKSPGQDARADGKPNLDFTKMNIMAAKSGLTTAKEQHQFRAGHQTRVRKFDHTKKTQLPLPSDKSTKHAYGMPSSYRTMDVIRNYGPQEPHIKHLVQGVYQDEWVRQNQHKEALSGVNNYIPPVPTRAAIGHTIGAQKYLRSQHTAEEWKLSKFKSVSAKVWMGKVKKMDGQGQQGHHEAPMAEQQQPQQEAAEHSQQAEEGAQA